MTSIHRMRPGRQTRSRSEVGYLAASLVAELGGVTER